MKNNVEKLLIELERRCNMEIYAPAPEDLIEEMKNMYPVLPRAVLDMYAISNGIEINIPGTVFYTLEEVKTINKRKGHEYLRIGVMSFGDEVVIGKDGKIYQIDHETGTEFFDWLTLEDFLADELLALD